MSARSLIGPGGCRATLRSRADAGRKSPGARGGQVSYLLLAPVQFGSEKLSVTWVEGASGSEQEAHSHVGREKVYVAVGGRGLIRVGDEDGEVHPGTVILVPPGTECRWFMCQRLRRSIFHRKMGRGPAARIGSSQRRPQELSAFRQRTRPCWQRQMGMSQMSGPDGSFGRSCGRGFERAARSPLRCGDV